MVLPVVDCFPELGNEMLTVFGALVSGAQHNAVKCISPATTKMLLKTVRDSDTSQVRDVNRIMEWKEYTGDGLPDNLDP